MALRNAPISQAKVQHKGGMTRSRVVRDYTLCPSELEAAAVDRYQYGIQVGHERDNWRKGKDDTDAILNGFNHLYEHVQRVKTGEGNYSDLQAIACNLAMILWWANHGTAMATVMPNLLPPGKDPK